MLKKILPIFVVIICFYLFIGIGKSADWTTPSSIYDSCSATGDEDTIDGSLSTSWSHLSSEHHWITYDLGDTYLITRVRIYSSSGTTYNPCMIDEVYICDDGACSGESDLIGTCSFSSGLKWNECDHTDTTGRYVKIMIGTRSGPSCSINSWLYSFYEFEVEIDLSPPTYSLNSTNGTQAGTPIEMRVKWDDETDLTTTGGYIFSFDNGTGTFANDSWVAFTSTPQWANVTKVVNGTVNSLIRWCSYANDTAGNWNSSFCDNPDSFLTTAPPSCEISLTLVNNSYEFGSLDPGTDDNPATCNAAGCRFDFTGTGCNGDFYIRAVSDYADSGNSIGIGNLTLNSSLSASLQTMTTAFQALNSGTDQATGSYYLYFFLDIPSAQAADYYNTTIEIKANQTT
jgi:hypothetical protein